MNLCSTGRRVGSHGNIDHGRVAPISSLHHMSSPEDLQIGTPKLDRLEAGLTGKAQNSSVDFMVMARAPSHKPTKGLWTLAPLTYCVQ